MHKASGHLRILGAILAFGVLAGCAQQATSPHTAVTMAPQLADARGSMIVDRVALVAKNNAATRMTVIGRTDRVGSQAANMALSQHRAERVRDALKVAGVPAAGIDTRWTGEVEQGVATNDQVAE